MTDAKNIYPSNESPSTLARTLSLVKPQTSAPKKSLFKRMTEFLRRPDLDLESYQRLEGLASPKERDVIQRWRDLGGRF